MVDNREKLYLINAKIDGLTDKLESFMKRMEDRQ